MVDVFVRDVTGRSGPGVSCCWWSRRGVGGCEEGVAVMESVEMVRTPRGGVDDVIVVAIAVSKWPVEAGEPAVPEYRTVDMSASSW